jgi:hypothetical protein
VGTGRAGALMLFKIGSTYSVEARAGFDPPQADHAFVHDGKPGALTVTAGRLVAVSDYTWKDGHSPLTTRRDELPILFPDVSLNGLLMPLSGSCMRAAEDGARW